MHKIKKFQYPSGPLLNSGSGGNWVSVFDKVNPDYLKQKPAGTLELFDLFGGQIPGMPNQKFAEEIYGTKMTQVPNTQNTQNPRFSSMASGLQGAMKAQQSMMNGVNYWATQMGQTPNYAAIGAQTNNLTGTNTGINTGIGVGGETLTKEPKLKKFKDFLGKNNGLAKNALSAAPELIDAGLNLAGAKEATLQGTGDKAFQQISTTLFKGAIKSGNPWLIAGAGVLKGLDYFNRYAGKTTAKQGTDASLNTGAYNFQLSANAGQKTTVTKNNSAHNIDLQTLRADRNNILAADAAYKDKQNLLAGNNTYGDIFAKNQQKLNGTMSTNLLSAKKGAKINPKKLSNIKKRIKKAQEGTPTDDLQKIQQGGSFNSNKIMYVDSVLNANKHLDWVKRLYDENPESIQIPGVEGKSTHYMSDNDNGYVYPTVVKINGKLQYLGDRAEDYARETNTGIQLPKEEGTWFARNGYKQGTNVLRTFSLGGQMNVIPEGALHARKNHLEGEIGKQVTSKGIPVITKAENGKIIQHAEIENSEIIFNKQVSEKLDSWFKKYKDLEPAEKKKLELECGKLLTDEILENTEDNVGLIEVTE